jgi:hypothetical protein
MLLSEFIKDFGVKKYFRTPKNLDYSLLVNFIQLVLEGDWFGKASIPQDFSQNSDILAYFRVLDQAGHPERDALRFGDMYIILSKDRYRYGVFLNANAVLEQPNHLNPQHEVLHDDINKHIAWVKSRGFEVVLLRPLNEKNIFPSDDLRYIKQDKPFAHATLDIATNNITVYAPGNHATYTNPIWGLDPTNKQIEVLAKQEIYRPLWLHLLDENNASLASYEGVYDNAHFTTWEIPADELVGNPKMLALLRRSTSDYTTDDIKWTDKLPHRPIFYNVRDFGAAGNGTQDDTTYVEAAASAAHAAGGGTIYFPAVVGAMATNYKLTDAIALPEGVNVGGDGRHAVTITQIGTNKRGFYLTNGTSETVAELFMYGFKLVGTSSLTADGIFIEGRPLDYFRIHDVTVDGFAIGVHSKGAIVSRLEGVNAQNNTVGGIWVDGTDSFVTSVSLIACYGNGNASGAYGIKISKATYVAILGGAADSNDIGHYLLDCFSATINGSGSESNNTNWKIEGSGDFGSAGVNLVGVYSYDARAIGFDVVGFASNVQFIGCIDNFPNASATFSLRTSQYSIVTAIGCSWNNTHGNSIDPSCAYVELVDSDGNSHVRNLNLLRIRDTNGNLILDATALTPNAVNAFQIVNAATGHAPLFGPAGTDADIPGYYTSKGAGAVRLAKGDGSVLFQVDADHTDNTFYATPAQSGQAALFGVTSDDLHGGDADVTMYLQSKGMGDIRLAQLGGYVFANFSSNMAQPVNWPAFTAVNTGQAVEIGAAGGDTDIYLNLTSKGAGTVRANGHDVVTIDGAASLTNKTFPNVVIVGSSGTMTLNASPDASEYNIGVNTGGTLSLYGGAAEVLNLEMYDGDLGIGSQDPTKGLILTSPSFNRYRVTVDNSGVLVVTHI